MKNVPSFATGLYLLGVEGVDGWEQGFRPFQPSTQGMVDSEAIPDSFVVLVFGVLLLDLIEPCAPLRVGVLHTRSALNTFRTFQVRTYLEGCCSPFGGIAYNDLRIVVFEDA
jgi:hypothetical protein